MSKQPNIVFILNDHQAFYGHHLNRSVKPLRPHFDKFAKAGINFENAYCATPMCGPTRRSLLTGLYPHTHGQVHNENDPAYTHEVYLNTLAENGYKNYYYGKWHAGPGCAYDHNCEGLSQTSYGNPYTTQEYADYLERHNLPRATHYIEKVFTHDDFDRQNYFPKLKEGALYQCEDRWCGEHAIGITTTSKETHEAFFLANLACEKLEELANRTSDEPFHLRVDFWGPHQPFFPTQEFIDMYDPEAILPYPSFDSPLTDKPNTLKMESNRPLGDGEFITYPNPVRWPEWQLMLSRCYAHGTMVDEAGGRIINKLKELGLDENTIIIWSTDHGDAIACQGGHFDKDSHMAQEVQRIPMAMCWKDRIAPNQINNDLVFTCDIPVTMLDSADLSFSERVDGDSLLKLATPSDAPWRDSLMCETYGHGYGTTIIGRMVVKGNFKYVCTENDLDELYDLAQDPYEMKNLACLSEFDAKKQEMREILVQKQKESLDPISLEQLIGHLN
ncbi:MAG: sulfatase-like hydrolase/transferase [Cellulosilyticaceae bacterium]